MDLRHRSAETPASPAGKVRIPPRPDLGPPPRRRGPWLVWAMAAAGVVTLVALTVRAAVEPLPLSRLLPSATPTRPEGGQYRFLRYTADGPYRWDPCGTISYEVNLTNAPPGALTEIREATRRVSEVTGIPFVEVGTTTRTVGMQLRSAGRSGAPGESRFYPVLIGWVAQERFRVLADSRRALAFALSFPGSGPRAGTYASGVVALDAGVDWQDRRGFSWRDSLGVVLMHELGHIMGLAHVSDPGELMWSPDLTSKVADPSQAEWGPGDLQGLRILGRNGQACGGPESA